jgi:hypothetical protein
VGFDPESARRKAAEVPRAGLDLEHRVTDPAVEVMKMTLAGAFVAIRATGELDCT